MILKESALASVLHVLSSYFFPCILKHPLLPSVCIHLFSALSLSPCWLDKDGYIIINQLLVCWIVIIRGASHQLVKFDLVP